MTKINYTLIIGHDPAEPEPSIPSAATFIGNPSCEVAGPSWCAEDIRRDLLRMTRDRVAAILRDSLDRANPTPEAREGQREALLAAAERARDILSVQALSANLIPHASIRANLLFNSLPFGENDP